MASLEKLFIAGMRSYGSNAGDEQTLKFLKPVTLILGENGCGKSTIIECLRFITAQKEPTGKGVLIHDPDLATGGLVKAQVTLQLKDSKGQEFHLKKMMQATRTTKKALQTKSLDSTITNIDPVTKKPRSISNRCVDFTPEVMKILGVSKAILENVIFCTQEDANWPLETDQKLKEKFDQIFDSDKYNKCLKKVREKQKELIKEKKTREIELKYLKENKSSANNKRRELKKLEEEISNLDQEKQRLDESLDPLYQKLSEINAKEEKVSSTYTAFEMKKLKLEESEKAENNLINMIRKGKYEFLGTMGELESALSNCDAVSRSVDELKGDLIKLQRAEKDHGEVLSKKLSNIGELRKEVEINEAKVEERKRKMTDLANHLKMNNPHLSQDGLERRITAKEKQISFLVEQCHSEEEKLEAVVNDARDLAIKNEMEVKKKKENLESLIKERDDLKMELENVEQTQIRREEVADELKIVETKLKKLGESDVNKMNANLKRMESEMQSLEQSIRKLEDELKEIAEYEVINKKLAELKADSDKKSSEIRRLKNSHEDALIDLLDQVPESDFKEAVQSRSEQLASKIRELRTRKTGVEKESITSQNNSRTVRASLQAKRGELQMFTDQVSESTGGEELDSAVKRLEENVKELQDEKGALSSASLMYEQYIKRLKKEKPCCPLCERDFAAEAEAKKLIADLQSKMKKVPVHLERVNNELEGKQEKLKALVVLHLQYEKMEAMRESEIPSLMKSLEESQKSITKCQKELDDIEKELQRLEKDRDLCTTILGDMSLLDRLVTETSEIKKDLVTVAKGLPVGWNSNLLQEAEAKKSNLAAQLKSKSDDRLAIQSELNSYNEQLLELQKKKNSLDAEDLKLRSSSGQLQHQQDRLVSLRGIENDLRTDLKLAEQSVLPLKKSVEEKNKELKLLKDANRQKERDLKSETDKLFEQLREIKRLGQEIEDFEEGKAQVNLEKLRNEVKKYEEEISKCKIEMEDINAKLGDLSKSVVRRRELEDNKAYREKVKEREELKKEVDELRNGLKNLDYEQLNREKRKLKAEEERIGQRKAEISGQKGGIISQVSSLKRELCSNMYVDIDAKYKEELVQMHLADALGSDLMRYAVAMDHAMGVYHARQMERVNSIIREYWRKIYRGNDIDYIEIIPEQSQLTETRRNYNYKLVQVRGDIQLELRNRCSAGQKMLTSLIVRMALAEVFSNNCGILTLDEPTTNLDRKNIQNLAVTLNELITMKRSLRNSNFQLIIITHDREFLDELVNYNDIEEYVEVSRNNEGKSQLKVHKVNR